MDSVNKEILAKVKKLMALGESPSEAEAASALEKARILLARYGLSLTDVEAHSPDVVEGILLEKKRLRSWESHLIHVIASCTFTKALHVHRQGIGQVLLIGRELNTLAASDLFAYLHLVVLKLGRAHSGQVSHLESFKRGIVQRIGERLLDLSAGTEEAGGPWAAPQKDAKTDSEPFRASKAHSGNNSSTVNNNNLAAERSDRQLTVQMAETASRENRAFISKKYGKTSTRRIGSRVDSESYHRGRTVGEGVSLNRQLR